MNEIRYLLDEHVDPRLRRAIKEQLPQLIVWRVGDIGAPGYGSSDPDILIWCEANEFVLVTNNRKSMPDHLRDHVVSGRHVPGIFILNPRMPLGQTADELALIAETSHPNEYEDQLRYLPLSQ